MRSAAFTALRLVFVALLLLAGIALFQDHLLYFPTRTPIAQMVGDGLRAWPSEQDFRGLLAEPAGRARGTAIVFHGNAGHAAHREDYAHVLTQLGLRVILAEYPGYGPRDGTLGESNFVADAGETITRAHASFGGPLVVIGESLGAAVAAAAAARHADKLAGLLLITPWDRLEHIAAYHYPWLPVRWMLRDRYDSAAHLASVGLPVLVAVAEHDTIVPRRFGLALHAALIGRKRLVVIPAADHNDWFDRVDARWWRDALAFVLGESG